MAIFKVVVRRMRPDGFYPVYIRISHRRGIGYIRTDKMVTRHELSKNGDIEDAYVLQFCTKRILEYNERLNKMDISNWSVKEIIDFLTGKPVRN